MTRPTPLPQIFTTGCQIFARLKKCNIFKKFYRKPATSGSWPVKSFGPKMIQENTPLIYVMDLKYILYNMCHNNHNDL